MTEELLELLQGAGLTIDSLDGDLGGLDGQLKALAEDAGKVDGLTTDLETAKNEAETNFTRMKNKDTSLSEKDLRIKKLEDQLSQASTSQGVQTNVNDDRLEALQSTVQELADSMTAVREQNVKLEADIKWRATVDRLAEELPALKEAKFQALIPRTADEEDLRRVGGLLGDFTEATQDAAYKQVRDGYVPSSVPPRVTPDKPESLQKEMQRVNAMLDSGELSNADAKIQMTKIAAMMKPQ